MPEEPPTAPPAAASPSPAALPPPRDLITGERVGAGIVGGVGVVSGGLGVFLSDNQAGTAVILLLGAVFLIMSIQGTAILKITKEGGDFAARDARRRGRELLDRAEDAVVEGEADEAVALVEEAKEVAPGLSRDMQLRRVADSAYELQLFDAIDRVIHERFDDRLVLETSYWVDGRYRADGVIYPKDNPARKIIIEVASSGHQLADLFGHQVKGEELPFPLLVVTRSLRSRPDRIERLNTVRRGKLRVVTWDGPADIGRLGDELEYLARDILS